MRKRTGVLLGVTALALIGAHNSSEASAPVVHAAPVAAVAPVDMSDDSQAQEHTSHALAKASATWDDVKASTLAHWEEVKADYHEEKAERQAKHEASSQPKQGDEVPGTCRVYVGKITVYSCAPVSTPAGGIIQGKVAEDSSARYDDGSFFDAEDHTLSKPTKTVPNNLAQS
jgi:hypothetical protein